MVTRELKHGRKKYDSVDRLRSLKNIVHVYRCLQVFQTNTLCLFGPFLVVLNAIFMLCTIYANFVMMRYWKGLDAVSKALFISITFALVPLYLVI